VVKPHVLTHVIDGFIILEGKWSVTPINYRCEDGRFSQCPWFAWQFQTPIRFPAVKQRLILE
jgi:hypothetical protein